MSCGKCQCMNCNAASLSDAFQRIDRLEHDRNEQAKDIARLRKSVHRLGGIVEKLRAKANEPHVITAQSCGSDCCPSDCPDCAAWQEENWQHFLPLKEFDKAVEILRGVVTHSMGVTWYSTRVREALKLLGVGKS